MRSLKNPPKQHPSITKDKCRIGIGFRRDLIENILDDEGDFSPSFVELAPENWMGIGGHWKSVLKRVAERYPMTCHGLSLSLGSPEDLDWNFLRELKTFFNDYPIEIYSEHLSYNKCDNAHLYDLLPIPFTEDAVKHVSKRIRQVQDFLGRKIAIENVSYYTPVTPEMDEATFISAIVKESDCQLLLDVNNVYVNSFNHRYDPKAFIKALPLDRVAYIHMAGHEQESEDLIIDTHGEPIIDPVYDLFDWTIQRLHPVPVLLERDFNFPEYQELVGEMTRLREITQKHWTLTHAS
ncbi:UPF0276 protein PSEEN3355 [Chlamydiales bacterium SCGC AG-110-M15]|nr:UPF0276 protein PSEEN3355 [Chlamydiales bacterium SCGC AG-110-M15]